MTRARAAAAVALTLSATAFTVSLDARATRLEIIDRQPAADGRGFGTAGAFEVLRGRISGELDPQDPRNAIIQDIRLAPRNANGKVDYVATFALVKPLDASKASGVLVYQVVNRGNGQATPSAEGHISLVSGWQGDLTPTAMNQTIKVPIATNPDGSPVTGPVLARFVDLPPGTTTASIRLSSMGNGPPVYPPFSPDTSKATLTVRSSETVKGGGSGVVTVPASDWAFADCRTKPFPGAADPTRLCVKNGFQPNQLYELVYTARDPLVLGIGLAATRDIVAFFRRAKADDFGTPNPVAGLVSHAISIGNSQSGNFIKTFIHLGFNQDEAGRIVWDGAFPRIAARQTPLNFRFALPGGAATMYEPGSEPVLWWGTYTDSVRGRTAASLLDRCHATNTCPKIIESFGSTEFWGLRMSPGLVGTDARRDIPLPDNVRRYYFPGVTHGGGRGGFQIDPTGQQPGCTFAANPNPSSDTNEALEAALVAWVTKGTPPPASRYPKLVEGALAPATRSGVGFPHIPGLPFTDELVNVVIDYDFGSSFNYNDLSGIITRQPPRIKQTIPTLVPKVNADGNETAGVPSVLHQAPLGTYLGWNVRSTGFYKGQICGFAGGYVPFARTKTERERAGDPRLSLEERYGAQEGYLCVVDRAVKRGVVERFLLPSDADRLTREAAASRILPALADSGAEQRETARALCRL